jgi:hypothetical protein
LEAGLAGIAPGLVAPKKLLRPGIQEPKELEVVAVFFNVFFFFVCVEKKLPEEKYEELDAAAAGLAGAQPVDPKKEEKLLLQLVVPAAPENKLLPLFPSPGTTSKSP